MPSMSTSTGARAGILTSPSSISVVVKRHRLNGAGGCGDVAYEVGGLATVGLAVEKSGEHEAGSWVGGELPGEQQREDQVVEIVGRGPRGTLSA